MQSVTAGEIHRILNSLKAEHPSLDFHFFMSAEAIAKAALSGKKHVTDADKQLLLSALHEGLPKQYHYALPQFEEKLDRAIEGNYGGSLLS